MKKYILLGLFIVFLCLIIAVIVLSSYTSSLQEKLSVSDSNFKALSLENKDLENQAIAYKFNIEQLEYLNDSIINVLNNTRKQLKIKDKDLLYMQTIKTEIVTKDSIFIKDTVFRDSNFKLDTTICDNWHKLAVTVTNNKLAISANYISDLKVFARSSKEILGTPKKCVIGRLFQKKHNVIRVDVLDSNPHSIIKEKKFVIIE